MSGHSSTLFIQSVVIFHHVCLRCNTVQFHINKPFHSIINMSWFKLLLLLTSPYTKVQIVYKIGHWVVNYDWLLSVKAHSGGWKLLRFCLRMRHTVAVQLIKTFLFFATMHMSAAPAHVKRMSCEWTLRLSTVSFVCFSDSFPVYLFICPSHTRSMWPDVGVKSRPIVSKVALKVATVVFT